MDTTATNGWIDLFRQLSNDFGSWAPHLVAAI